MDDCHFDELTKSLVSRIDSRRATLRLLISGALGVLAVRFGGHGVAEADQKDKPPKDKKKDKTCPPGCTNRGGRCCSFDGSCATGGACCPDESRCGDGSCVRLDRCCPEDRRCADGTCIPTGSQACCTEERRCPEGTCIASGTCCADELRCDDGTCLGPGGGCCPEFQCADGSCVAPGICCPEQRQCPGGCVPEETCCDGERRCADFSCVPEDQCCPEDCEECEIRCDPQTGTMESIGCAASEVCSGGTCVLFCPQPAAPEHTQPCCWFNSAANQTNCFCCMPDTTCFANLCCPPGEDCTDPNYDPTCPA